MKFLRPFGSKTQQKPTAYSLVDVGRDTVKAAVVLVIPGNNEPQIIGHGIAETGNHDITGGRLEAGAVTHPVNEALVQAEDSAEQYIGRKIVPDDVIFSVAGRAVIGKLITVKQSRTKPLQPIAAKELDSLRLRAEKLIPEGLAEVAYEGGQWQPLAVSDAGILLDGRLVVGGVGLTGREISLSMFGVAVQTSALRALEVLASQLDLAIANVVASPHALASITPHTEAIILDVGFSGTDVCLIKNDALAGTDWTPFGGHFFTQSLAKTMGIGPIKARNSKHAFANGLLPADESSKIEEYLENPLERWHSSVMDILVRLSIGKPLPRRIYLTGGGSLLPGLDRFLKINATPFEAVPEVSNLGRQSLLAIKDLTDGMNYNLMPLTLGLAVGLPESG